MDLNYWKCNSVLLIYLNHNKNEEYYITLFMYDHYEKCCTLTFLKWKHERIPMHYVLWNFIARSALHYL